MRPLESLNQEEEEEEEEKGKVRERVNDLTYLDACEIGAR